MMVKIYKHCNISCTLSCYSIINSDGDYIQELIPHSELDDVLESLDGVMVNDAPTGDFIVRGDHDEFYRNLN
ncbi:MAG: hypothetical protein HRU18_03790 [Pseudoalteromonas sp.]|uniref:hypothetical protein n=1 Tax=Pseudoalteromonas sp. TaxID=53249 RepID=UPI001D94555F|nr:hypothetical protein [Pseudoalteromonas sp.]NRA77309.1 hypothetical protein [Pseudoalteromonas sp.]